MRTDVAPPAGVDIPEMVDRDRRRRSRVSPGRAGSAQRPRQRFEQCEVARLRKEDGSVDALITH
jgi:hypothetical protein